MGYPEDLRVRALALAATTALWKAQEGEGGDERQLRRRQQRTALRVRLQFMLLQLIAAVLSACGWLAAACKCQ